MFCCAAHVACCAYRGLTKGPAAGGQAVVSGLAPVAQQCVNANVFFTATGDMGTVFWACSSPLSAELQSAACVNSPATPSVHPSPQGLTCPCVRSAEQGSASSQETQEGEGEGKDVVHG